MDAEKSPPGTPGPAQPAAEGAPNRPPRRRRAPDLADIRAGLRGSPLRQPGERTWMVNSVVSPTLLTRGAADPLFFVSYGRSGRLFTEELAFNGADVGGYAAKQSPAAPQGSSGSGPGDYGVSCRALLRQWAANTGHAGPVGQAARRLWEAALATRQALAYTDPATGYEAVSVFMTTCLGFANPSPARREAVVQALLSDDWIQAGEDARVHATLRREIDRAHRSWRPLAETQINYRPIAHLSAPAGRGDSALLTIEDTLVAATDVESQALACTGWDNEHLARVLAQLEPDELAVARAYADDALTWEQAAATQGLATHTVRRKLQRLGREHSARQARIGAAA